MITKKIKEYRQGNKAIREVRVSFCRVPLFCQIEETTNYNIVEALNSEETKKNANL